MSSNVPESFRSKKYAENSQKTLLLFFILSKSLKYIKGWICRVYYVEHEFKQY